MRVALLADTHIPSRARDLPKSAWKIVAEADLVLHAGDIVVPRFLDDLAAVTTTHAVRGNNDHRIAPSVPERLELDLEGVSVAVIHDAGPATGRRAHLRRLFPGARVVVFGHSHIPLVEDDGDLLMVNPGSPTDRRRMPTYTMGTLDIEGTAPRAEIIDLGLERAT